MTGSAIYLDDELTPVLTRIGLAVTHPGELTSAFAAYLVFSTQRRFELETGPDGQKWQALARRTQLKKIRGRQRGANNILRVTTALYRSVVGHSDERSASVGSNLVYARVHQEGGQIQMYARSQRASLAKIRGKSRFVTRGKKGSIEKKITIGEHTIPVPARPYLGFSAEDRTRLVEIGQDYLEGQAR